MRRSFRHLQKERGATMVEVMMVIVLIAGVLGAITALSTSVSKTYAETSLYTINHRDASIILNQLAQDIRRSVAEVQPTSDHNAVTIQTATTDGRTVEKSYWVTVRGEIRYSSDGVEMTLTEHGTDSIPQKGQFTVSELGTGNYQIEVNVFNSDRQGEKINEVSMSTEVARYNWGNQR